MKSVGYAEVRCTQVIEAATARLEEIRAARTWYSGRADEKIVEKALRMARATERACVTLSAEAIAVLGLGGA